MEETQEKRAQIKIYRAADAPTLAEAACMTLEPLSEEQSAGMAKMVDAGFLEGEEIQILVDMPGFFLAHVWFKKAFPLPRHSHDVDCMYYIVAGSLQMGTHELGPRDCFFIPAGVPYTYTPGPQGVEVLEIRHATAFNFKALAHNEAWWEKAAQTCLNNANEWKNASRPSKV